MIPRQVNTPDVLGKQRWAQWHRRFVLHAKYNESDSIYILSTLFQYIILKLIFTVYDNVHKNEAITEMCFFLFDLFCVVVSLSPRCNFSLIDWLRAQKKSLIQSSKRCCLARLLLEVNKVQMMYSSQFAYRREGRAEVRGASSGKQSRDVSVRDVSVNANTPPNIRLFET